MQKQYDFTEGNILKQLIFFSGPIILTNLLQTSYQVVDSLWIGNLLGADALGAVAISGAIIFTMLSFVIGLNNAALTILSQQKGKGNHEGLKSYLKQLIFFSGLIILTNLLQTSYQVVDSLWIGNLLGADALGAVAISGAIIFTMLSFVIGLNNAALTILSQQKGKGNHEGLKSYL